MICNKVVTSGAPTLKVPAHLSVGKHFLERISYNCDRAGDGVGLINGNTGEEATFGQILQDTVNVAVGLKQRGVRRGDVVAFHSENRIELIAGFMGALCCGATVTVYSTLYNADDLTHAINISKPSMVISSAATIEAHLNLFKSVETIKEIVQINGDPAEGVLPLSEIVGYGDPRSFEPEPVEASDVAIICYSSGTTGQPKGVMLSHVNILFSWSTFDYGQFLEVSDRILSSLPWFHVFGLLTTTHYLTCHKKIIFLKGFNAETYLSTIEKYKAIGLLVVPPIVVYLVKSPLVAKYDVSSVKFFWCGAAPLSQQTADAAMKIFPKMIRFLQGYGMTETTLAVLKDEDTPGCAPGFVPVPGCKLKVVDLTTGEKLGPNEEGEICVKGPMVMKGYINNEAATKASYDEEGYLKTGDIGSYDEKGFFYIVDRLKEIIKYKGYQVAPAVVESVILHHAAVADCAVVGAPDDLTGELPTAFVVLKQGAQLTEQELIDFTNAKVSPLSRIRGGVIFTDIIPKNASGKILRRLLKQKLRTH